MHATLHGAANGHLTLNLHGLPDSFWQSLSSRHVREFGFWRVGTPVISPEEQIHQSFECPRFVLAAGRDNWSGHYLLSESAEGDDFLRELFNTLGA